MYYSRRRRWRRRWRPQMLKFSLKFLRPDYFHLFTTDLIHLWYDDTYWSKIFAQYHPHHPRSCQCQGHRLRIFMLKFYVKVFRISLLLHLMMDLAPIWYHDIYWLKVFISTISTHDLDLKVEVKDLEYKC